MTSSIVPATKTIEGCDWEMYPVYVSDNSEVFQNKNALISIIDKTLQNPIHAASLDVTNLCPIATAIETDYRQAMQNYHDKLKNAIRKDKGRDRQVSYVRTLSICSTYDKLVDEFKTSKRRQPKFLEKLGLRIQSVFVKRTCTEVETRHFSDEYSDYHRREWMVAVVTDENARIKKAIRLITEGATKYATNIQNARKELRPVNKNDLIYLQQMINLHEVLKPNQPLLLGHLGLADNYLNKRARKRPPLCSSSTPVVKPSSASSTSMPAWSKRLPFNFDTINGIVSHILDNKKQGVPSSALPTSMPAWSKRLPLNFDIINGIVSHILDNKKQGVLT